MTPAETAPHGATYGDAAPIAALATPLAETALALIRTSGHDAIQRLSTVFSRPKQLLTAQGNSIVYGWMVDAACQRIDEVLVAVYRAPRSYTGEDGADISCHGGIATIRAVLRLLYGAGFREALPGEFTFRAFMNGKLDLTRAESVMELVSAKTERARQRAVNRLAGSLEQEITGVKDLLVQVLAGTELLLDYSEDEAGADGEEAGGLPDRALAEQALTRLTSLAASYSMEKLYHDGALVVLAGMPNAGKSSLFNLLVKEERSIVTDVPGTTRDWIEAAIAIAGIPIRLVDTAGLHTSVDAVELLGMERSFELLAAADLTLYLIDAARGCTAEDTALLRRLCTADRRLIVVWSKVDAAPAPVALPEMAGRTVPSVAVSATTRVGVNALCATISATLEAAADVRHENPSGVATERQKRCVDTARSAVEEALTLAAQCQPLDIIAPLLHEAINALGEITGEVSTADLFDVMFSRFCVGK
ncbi:MAG: tRNA uridine-5-carboxymethylaminomethyl(34) synthesis GTPase MnmE [Treponema sp.]|jgi:tRNA modification GTPase|nr:tRNA uridine-5-carboxymethylaminomethyl(34) synthesis GTPase MnmE [Treponema sp.]